MVGLPQFLFAAEVSFGGLDRDVPEQELDLLQFPASYMTQASAAAPQVMRSKFRYA